MLFSSVVTVITRVWQCGQAVAHTLLVRWSRRLARVQGLSVLPCYMNDGWTANASGVTIHKVEDLKTPSEGRVRHEYPMERALLRSRRADGSTE